MLGRFKWCTKWGFVLIQFDKCTYVHIRHRIYKYSILKLNLKLHVCHPSCIDLWIKLIFTNRMLSFFYKETRITCTVEIRRMEFRIAKHHYWASWIRCGCLSYSSKVARTSGKPGDPTQDSRGGRLGSFLLLIHVCYLAIGIIHERI